MLHIIILSLHNVICRYISIKLVGKKKSKFPVFYQSSGEAVKVLWSVGENLELFIFS